jgi:ABC-type molybdate transport system substrate-binding protein
MLSDFLQPYCRQASLSVEQGFTRRRGFVSRPTIVILSSLALLAILIAVLAGWPRSVANSTRPLIIYCAASNKSVMEAVRVDYERTYGAVLQIQYGPSQTLLAAAEVSDSGDLYLPADDSYLNIARQRGLLAEQIPLATMQAVVAVPQGNPQRIHSLSDILQPGVRLAQSSVEATAIGKLTNEALRASGDWDAVHAQTTVYKTTVNDVASDVKVGAVDAGVVFDAVLHDYPTLEAIALPELADVQANVAIAVLKSSKQPQQALHFARYLAAQDKGLVHYRQHGFQALEGDDWSEQPEVTLYAGSMLRPAIEATITAFEEREGVRVTRVFNGCGILVAQMKAGEIPDGYFACDVEFMNQVEKQFDDRRDVSRNELVIMVKKGNPHNIASLRDLAKQGLRVGIGHEKQCAMGWLTQRTLEEGGVRTEVMKNVAVQTPTGDMLVNQMRSGSLDAAVAYLSNAAGSADYLDAVRIQDIPCSVATQPFGIANDSANKHLIARLRQAILAQESQDRFKAEGFQWIDAGNSAP